MIGMFKFTSNKKTEWSCNVRLNQVGRQTLFFIFFYRWKPNFILNYVYHVYFYYFLIYLFLCFKSKRVVDQ